MKTYVLREPNPVEPQTAAPAPRPRRPRAAPPVSPAPACAVLGQPLQTHTPRVLFVGLDVHTDSIAVSLAPADATEVRRYGLIGGTHDDVLQLAKKLHAAHPGAPLRFCYEAGPHGYPLARCRHAHG